MPSTRSSTRQNASTSPKFQGGTTSSKNGAGSKRKAAAVSNSSAKSHGKRTTPRKVQKTIEETIPDEEAGAASKSVETKNSDRDMEVTDEVGADQNEVANGHEQNQSEEQVDRESKTEEKKSENASGDAIQQSPKREEKVPSNILEKGVIYFFTRGRVGVEEPESVNDLARTYIVLRPIPTGAKLGDGSLEGQNTNRLMALPKKVLPKSGRDRFMAFVEKANASAEELREQFLPGAEYETKTAGTRFTPPVTPVGEGVYALTTTGRTSHLAYMLTIPSQPEPVQKDLGIREKGSFVTSLKNPTRPGPAGSNLPQGPEFPKEVLDEFGGRAWMPIHKVGYLDYPNAQLLLVGESDPDKALKSADEDQKDDKETPAEELEKLEGEDEIRVKHLHGDDSVFVDLGVSKKDYPDVLTTW